MSPAEMNLLKLALRQRQGDPLVTAEVFAQAILDAQAARNRPPMPSGPGVKDCCKDARNLRVADGGPDRVTQQCAVCGCRHFRVLAEPKAL